jgi:hypothetical protein
MTKRDNFSKVVRKILCNRVGQKCSFLECRINTIGPAEDPTKYANSGAAAHICAASPGGCRYNPKMTSETRKDISNGIWLY